MNGWTYLPAVDSGAVTSILAVKEPGSVYGQNISVILYERTPGGVWSGIAWNNPDQAVGVASGVVEALGEGALLPTIVDALHAAGIAVVGGVPYESAAVEGEAFEAGVFADDPLAPFFSGGGGDAPALLGVLVDLGWPAADQHLVPGEPCVDDQGQPTYSVECILNTVVTVTELIEGGATGLDPSDTPVSDLCLPT